MLLYVDNMIKQREIPFLYFANMTKAEFVLSYMQRTESDVGQMTVADSLVGSI